MSQTFQPFSEVEPELAAYFDLNPNSDEENEEEWQRCAQDPSHFINTYCKIYVANKDTLIGGELPGGMTGRWVPFRLWAGQERVLQQFVLKLLVIVLKARQLGLTWLALAFALWLMLFKPIATILLFSKRDDESMFLLSDERLRGMYLQLPQWMREKVWETRLPGHVWTLSNGSTAKAFPTTGGDSYTATLAIVDEADLIPNLKKLMGSVKPTIDGGGRMFLISRSNKEQPESEFKKIYRAAKQGLTRWTAIFLGWFERPERGREWYDDKVNESLALDGTLDTVWEQYPATDTEALAQKTLDKRIAPVWLERCYEAMEPIGDEDLAEAHAPTIPGLRVYVLPVRGRRYIIGNDPAEGNPTSHDSAIQVMDLESGEQCAVLAGKLEPRSAAYAIDLLGIFYNRAQVMVLRNNHGHAVINELGHVSTLTRLPGRDGKPGFVESPAGKAYMWDTVAEDFRAGRERVLLHDFRTQTQVGSIDGTELKALDGADDEADAWAACLVGRHMAFAQESADEEDTTGSYSMRTY